MIVVFKLCIIKMDDLRGYTSDDLVFELKRLRQKYEVLEADNRILRAEKDIAESAKSSSSDKSSFPDTEHLKEQRRALRNALIMSQQKHRLVITFLDLERNALRDVKQEVLLGQEKMIREMSQKLALVVKGVQTREYALQKRLQNMTTDLLNEKEKRELLILEVADLKAEKKVICCNMETLKKEFDNERSQMNEHFERISKKIDVYQREHAVEVASLRAEMTEKDKFRTDLELTFTKQKNEIITLTEEITKTTIMYNQCNTELKKEKDRFLGGAQELQSIRNELQSMTEKYTIENDTCNKLRTQALILSEQLQKLMDSHDQLSNDFNSVLSREQTLRHEIQGSSTDKGEMQRKLRSITDKLSEMEAIHANEITALQRKLAEEERKVIEARKATQKESHHITQLQSENKELQSVVISKNVSLAKTEEEIIFLKGTHSKTQDRVARLESELRSAEASLVSLRSDRDHLLDTKEQLKDAKALSEQKVSALRSELEGVKFELLAHNSTSNEVTTLQQQIASLKDTLASKQGEVEGLKDTIRRECEERTEMMLEISDLRDQIRRLSSTHMRSQSSSGVEMSCQTPNQQHSNNGQSERRGEGGGMLSQLGAKEGRGADTRSGEEDEAGGMSDANWAQIRKQNNSGGSSKAKRKSKYR
jgi:regulator of replication initiation timing